MPPVEESSASGNFDPDRLREFKTAERGKDPYDVEPLEDLADKEARERLGKAAREAELQKQIDRSAQDSPADKPGDYKPRHRG